MLMPSIFGENFLDDVFKAPFGGCNTSGMMKTDVKDQGNHYEVSINMPGFQTENLKAELRDGYLTVTASTSQDVGEENADTHYIRRERYSGSCSRSFYVGEAVTQDEIKASYTNGVLHLSIPKKEDKAAVERKNYISIEG